MTRPTRLVVVLGTATEVGKTWVACRVLEHLRGGGLAVAARKPAQSFDAADLAAGRTDAEQLGASSGTDPHEVCPPHRWYPVAMAPPMAADRLGEPPIALADLIDEIEWPDRTDVGVVEGAGGVRSPLAHDGDGTDLVRRLQPDLVLLVADAGLGTINAVRTSLDTIRSSPVLVVLNRFDPTDALHLANESWLRETDGFDVVTEPATAAERLRT